jgi:hypothetical protein
MNQHAMFLRTGCTLPDQINLHHQPFCAGWTEAIDTLVAEMDAWVRKAGWHFMWIEGSHSCFGLGRTPESAIHRALVRALTNVEASYNAAELGSLRITNCLVFQMAKVTTHARQIQEGASLDLPVAIRLQQRPAA